MLLIILVVIKNMIPFRDTSSTGTPPDVICIY
jgi:hypothetical protein